MVKCLKKKESFTLKASAATEVRLAGDFTNWEAQSILSKNFEAERGKLRSPSNPVSTTIATS